MRNTRTRFFGASGHAKRPSDPVFPRFVLWDVKKPRTGGDGASSGSVGGNLGSNGGNL